MAREYLNANAKRIAELAEKLGIEDSPCRLTSSVRVSCGNESFEAQGLMGRSRDYDWDTWRYGRKTIECKKCKRTVRETLSFEGLCLPCWSEKETKKRSDKSDDETDEEFPGRKVRL